MSRKHKQEFRPDFATTKIGTYGYVALFDDMLKSDAFKVLSGNAVKAYLVLRSQYNGTTPPTVTCAYSTFKRYGINEHMASKATSELSALGFITIQGGGYPDIANKYTFCSKWKTINAEEAKADFTEMWKLTHAASNTFK